MKNVDRLLQLQAKAKDGDEYDDLAFVQAMRVALPSLLRIAEAAHEASVESTCGIDEIDVEIEPFEELKL